jgi:hypothetical protein
MNHLKENRRKDNDIFNPALGHDVYGNGCNIAVIIHNP